LHSRSYFRRVSASIMTPKGIRQLRNPPLNDVEIRNIVRCQIPKTGVALHTHIRHPNPIGLHIDLIQMIDYTMIIWDVWTRFSGESSIRDFCHVGKGMNLVICSRIRLLYTRSQRGVILPHCLGDETRIIADRWIIVQIRDSQLESRSCRSTNRRRRLLHVGLERYIPRFQVDVSDDE
jgi:hypothetical protein